MKKLIIFYIVILWPMVIIAWLILAHRANNNILLNFTNYILIYRPIVEAYKLIMMGVASKRDWKIYLPFTHGKYFRELYLS